MNEHKYIETQTRKILSSYGGVGSIIETPYGALKVEEFDKWPFFKRLIDGDLDFDNYQLTDNRLLKRLQHKKGFPSLKAFIAVPISASNYKIRTKPEAPQRVISGEYFPKWLYCSNCNRFYPLNEWWKKWKMTREKYGMSYDKSKFIPPLCYHCFDEAKKKKKKRTKYPLEQVRFIMTSPSGEISDIPWKRWNKAEIQKKEEDTEIGIVALDFDSLCCENQDLRYIKSSKFSDLSGIQIRCENCKKQRNIAGLFGLRLKGKDEKTYLKAAIRTSNSVYYPLIVNSIYLPTKQFFNLQEQKDIEYWHTKDMDLDFIYLALKEKYKKQTIEAFIKNKIENYYESETEYRLHEYNYIIDNKQPNDENLLLDVQNTDILVEFGVENLIAVKRLKVTTVQTGYTRQEPLDKDKFLRGDNLDNEQITVKYTSTKKQNTEYLPAVENYGEGIFISISKDLLSKWLTHAFKNQDFKDRIESVWVNNLKREFGEKDFKDKQHLAKFLLIHTLSHLIIKELEFLCGYASTSINERLFIDKENMQGVLIYTVAGAEGSYGGLVSQANKKDFYRILKSALNRANDCASDPICFHSSGQGIGGLNLAACYSCALLPENTCEEFNSFLDRAVLIHEDYGFMRLIPQLISIK